MNSTEPLPPNFSRLDVALRSIGYSFEMAVADIVDNSIDAGAATILVRLFIRDDASLDLIVWDDGSGMTPATLREAMRFGSDVSKEVERLGKFGLGLKLASLSQAKELRVISQMDGERSGRAWLEDGISKGFQSTIFDARTSRRLLSEYVPEKASQKKGTLVCWSRLYRLGHVSDVDATAQKLLQRLARHLSLAFHRFLSGRARKTSIILDVFEQTAGRAGIPQVLDPLNPFGYETSGSSLFPARMVLGGGYKGKVKMVCHLWPPNSESACYKLPGGSNARQGFYFYRNNRLIQGGGWNGIREIEPHSSLARVEIDIPQDIDVVVGLDVKKVEVHLPQDLISAIQTAASPDGIDFKRYIAFANEAYRKKKPTTSELPLIPSAGLPSPLRDFLHTELRHAKTAKHRDLSFEWGALPATQFFDIDRDGGRLVLNRTFRKALLHGSSASSADVPVLKCLLFLVLRDVFLSERTGSRIREQIEQTNRILLRAAKFERISQ